tara:strand:+ start:1026 stop:1364 length:339 start_codon:yes stop_codon:yes gene_type:complete
MLDEKTELDEDIAAEMQMVNDLRNFLNRDREGKSWLDINEDGVVDLDDLRDSLLRFEWIMLSGLLLAVLPLMNILGITNIDGDLFWSLAGFCLLIEGMISVYQIRVLRRKYQ